MRWILVGLFVAIEALTTYAAPSAPCEGDCVTIPTKEYVNLTVALYNSEADFRTCTNKLRQNQAANKYAMPE